MEDILFCRECGTVNEEKNNYSLDCIKCGECLNIPHYHCVKCDISMRKWMDFEWKNPSCYSCFLSL